MKKLVSILLSVIILAASLSIGFSAFAAEAPVKYNSQKQQFNSQATAFNFSGNKTVKLIYDDPSDKYKVYYSEKLGKKGKAIFTVNEYTNLAIKGNYVFYTDTKKGAIIRRKLTGKSAKKIITFTKNKFSAVRFIICGSRLIYNLIQYDEDGNFKSSKLYAATTKGKNRKLIAKNVDSETYMYKNMLYFLKGNNIMRYSFADGVLKSRYVGLRNFEGAHLVNMENNILYIAYLKGELNNVCNFYKVDVDKQKYWKIQGIEGGDPIHSALIYEGKTYAITGTGAGSAFAAITGYAYDYKSYQKLYDVGGENLAFFKNNIILDNYKVNSSTGDYSFSKYVIMVKK